MSSPPLVSHNPLAVADKQRGDCPLWHCKKFLVQPNTAWRGATRYFYPVGENFPSLYHQNGKMFAVLTRIEQHSEVPAPGRDIFEMVHHSGSTLLPVSSDHRDEK